MTKWPGTRGRWCSRSPLPARDKKHPRSRLTKMKYAICNETFEGWDHPRVCQTAARLGYQGLELAPFTLAPRVTDVTAAQRQLLRRQAEDAGLTIIGLH